MNWVIVVEVAGTKEAKEVTHFIWQKQEPQEQN